MTDLTQIPALRSWQEWAAGRGPYQVPDYARFCEIVTEHEARRDRIEALTAERDALAEKLAEAVEALERIDSITVHSGGEIHGVTAQHWQTAFEVARDEATIALAALQETDR